MFSIPSTRSFTPKDLNEHYAQGRITALTTRLGKIRESSIPYIPNISVKKENDKIENRVLTIYYFKLSL